MTGRSRKIVYRSRPMSSETAPLPTRLARWASGNPIELALLLILAGLVVYFYGFVGGYGPKGTNSALDVLRSSWNVENDYEHGYLVAPLILGLLVWRFWKLDPGPREFAWPGLLVLVGGLLLWVLAWRLIQWRVGIGSLTVLVFSI